MPLVNVNVAQRHLVPQIKTSDLHVCPLSRVRESWGEDSPPGESWEGVGAHGSHGVHDPGRSS